MLIRSYLDNIIRPVERWKFDYVGLSLSLNLPASNNLLKFFCFGTDLRLIQILDASFSNFPVFNWTKYIPNKIIFLLFMWTSFLFAEYQYDLSVCMIFRDEAPYLKEWIEFHRLMGVEHFYLCSHNSQDHYRQILNPYIRKGIVDLKEIISDEYERLEAFSYIQVSFYNECLQKAKNVSKWIAFIDSDEFLFPTKANDLPSILKEYVAFGGVAVNWQIFGTSAVKKMHPQKLMIEQLICCASNTLTEDNIPIKSIVQPKLVVGFEFNPHSLIYLSGYYQVNTDKHPFMGPYSPYIQVDQLRINHYWTRDEDYFVNVKIPRRNKWLGWTVEDIKNLNDKYNYQTDFTIQRFVRALRHKMGM